MGARPSVTFVMLYKVPTYVPEELIMSASTNIIKATRMTRWSTDQPELLPTTTIKVLWSGKTARKSIPIGYLGSFPTKPYNQQPNQCYRCMRFGHIATTCSAEKPKCRLCGEGHSTEVCRQKKAQQQTITVKCANCQGPHPASLTPATAMVVLLPCFSVFPI